MWNEVGEPDGAARPVYRPLLKRISAMAPREIKNLEDHLEATLREMGVTFDISRGRRWGRKPWHCDILPHMVSPEEWETIARGMRQRLVAFECFLRDIYGPREILRSGMLPVQPVLASPYFQRLANGLPRAGGAFLHLSGLCLTRLPDGRLAVKQHYFSNASGVSYMMQNRRALARVIPGVFEGHSTASIADVPTDILEVLRGFSGDADPTVVLLSPGQASAAYSEHSFLARRMGIPLVQGSDLVVVKDAVYLKTIAGLERVHVIYSRVADPWLDPLVFNPESLLGVPGLAHCIRQGSVVLVNSIGSQVADDRALLPLAPKIIRFYLGEAPLLPSLPTLWLGEIDQREEVLASLQDHTIRPLYGEPILTPPGGAKLTDYRRAKILNEVRQGFSSWVAQPRPGDGLTLCFHRGKPVLRHQDMIVFALRRGENDWQMFPGALTRVSTETSEHVASELGGGSKDTWVESPEAPEIHLHDAVPGQEPRPPAHHITSRVAEAFYWTGRYLERAAGVAGMISTIEILELEELNPTERKLYRPVWNHILPPLENRAAAARRNLSSARGRYHLALDAAEQGSVASSALRATSNAASIVESLSVEAWAVLEKLRERIKSFRFAATADEEKMSASTRRFCELNGERIPQFFGVAENTMVLDGGWRFCLIGQLMERASITANALTTMAAALGDEPRHGERGHAEEIQLSAFLRMLGNRDAYRRVYQMRIEFPAVLELLWMNETVPRSVSLCLLRIERLLGESHTAGAPATTRMVRESQALRATLRAHVWEDILADAPSPRSRRRQQPSAADLCGALCKRVFELHELIADGFLNHQIHMGAETQPLLEGFEHAPRYHASH